MAQIGWGRPKLEIGLLPASGSMADIQTWISLPTPVEGTCTLNTTKGDKKEAKVEGGGYEDIKYNKNTYALELELFAKKGRTKPISDVDGVVEGLYAVRLQPEDATVQGIIIPKCAVSVEDTWSAEDGGKWKYTFDVLEPETGNQILWQVVTLSTDSTSTGSTSTVTGD